MVKSKPQHDPRQMLHLLDGWRASLASQMHLSGNIGSDVYYLSVQALSYRYECILCRHIQRTWQRSERADWSEWAKMRLRSALMELDTIAMRVLAKGTLEEFPTSL